MTCVARVFDAHGGCVTWSTVGRRFTACADLDPAWFSFFEGYAIRRTVTCAACLGHSLLRSAEVYYGR